MSYLENSDAKPKATLAPVAIPAQAANAGAAGITKTELVAVVAPMAQAPPMVPAAVEALVSSPGVGASVPGQVSVPGTRGTLTGNPIIPLGSTKLIGFPYPKDGVGEGGGSGAMDP